MQQDQSPLTGVIAEDHVVIDFGENEGKSVMEISETQPNFYQYLIQQKEMGNFVIKRTKDKVYKLYVHKTISDR